MARLIACATGNWTSSSTWGVADTSSVIDSELGTLSITTSTSTHISPTATPGAITIDGVLLKISSRPGSSGTLTVVLRNTTAGSDVTSVTVNITDLPINGWVFFKFSAPQTLLAATNYATRVTTSANSLLVLFRSTASAQEYCRMWRTTTNAAPAAGDQMIISNEYTGAGTSNALTVTMDETANTIYGSTSYVDSLAVSGGATLDWGTSAATNYLLRVAGFTSVFSQSTWNQGTSGARIPSDSTATFESYGSANVDSGFQAKNGSIVNRYGNIITSTKTVLTTSVGGYCTTAGTAVTRVFGQPFTGMTGTFKIGATNYTISSVTNADSLTLTATAGTQSNPVIYTHAGTANVIQVTDTTGWAVGDSLLITSTSTSLAEYESATILTVDSSTQVTLSSALTNSHLGESPIQAAVMHMTRNVKVQGRSATVQGFNFFDTSSTVEDSYVEFFWQGSGTTNRRGIQVATVTGSYTSIGCVLRNFEVTNSCGLFMNTSTNNNISVSYLNIFNIHLTCITISATSGTNISFDNITGVRNTSGAMFIFNDVGSSYTNIYAHSFFQSGISINEASNVANINGLYATSGPQGIVMFNITGGTISNIESRQTTVSPSISLSSTDNLIIDGVIAVGNTSGAIGIVSSNNVIIKNGIFASSILANASLGLLTTSDTYDTYFVDCSFGVSTSFNNVFSQADIQSTSGSGGYYYFQNCLFGSVSTLSSLTALNYAFKIYSHNHNQVVGTHRTYNRYGMSSIDTVTYRTASPAETLTPNSNTSSSLKLRSTETQPIAIDNGQTATVTVYVYKSALYNGNQPRLMIKRNEGIGVLDDTVLATASGGTGSWLTLSGTTAAATADGAFVCYVDCDGTVGTVTVDDWSVS